MGEKYGAKCFFQNFLGRIMNSWWAKNTDWGKRDSSGSVGLHLRNARPHTRWHNCKDRQS